MVITPTRTILSIKVEVFGQESVELMKLHEIGLGEGESCFMSYDHFRSMLGLCGEGRNLRKSSIDEFATKAE
jgi:hypothetical protein